MDWSWVRARGWWDKFRLNDFHETNLTFKREKETHIQNLNETIKQQKQQAEKALNELKKQVEYNSNKLYDDMKEQVCDADTKEQELRLLWGKKIFNSNIFQKMTKIENDLQRSKMLREKQSKDFQKQLEDVQNENAAKLEQLQNDNENEKLKMKRQFEVEKLALKKETLDACAELQGQLQTQLVEINEQHKVKVEKLVLVSWEIDWCRGLLRWHFFVYFQRPWMKTKSKWCSSERNWSKRTHSESSK